MSKQISVVCLLLLLSACANFTSRNKQNKFKQYDCGNGTILTARFTKERADWAIDSGGAHSDFWPIPISDSATGLYKKDNISLQNLDDKVKIDAEIRLDAPKWEIKTVCFIKN